MSSQNQSTLACAAMQYVGGANIKCEMSPLTLCKQWGHETAAAIQNNEGSSLSRVSSFAEQGQTTAEQFHVIHVPFRYHQSL